MTWEQYWNGDVWMVNIYREADKRRMERTNAEAHLMGTYIYEALCDVSPVLHAFAKNGTKPIEYRKDPYPLFGKNVSDEETEQQEERDAVFAKAYMRQMVRAGKNWGKKQ